MDNGGHSASSLAQERLIVQRPPVMWKSVCHVLCVERVNSVRLGEPTLVFGSVNRRWAVGNLDIVCPLDKGEVGDLVDGTKLFDTDGLEICPRKEVMPINGGLLPLDGRVQEGWD